MTKTNPIPPPPLGNIVRQVRKQRHLTLEQLADRCSVSKSMLSQIERGQVNPTFAVGWNLTQALGLDLNLIGAQAGNDKVIEHLHAYSTPTRKSADGLCDLRLLSPSRTVLPAEWYQMTLASGGCLNSGAHTPGTYEHFTCLSGRVRIEAGDKIAVANTGDTLRYHADQPHRIINNTDEVSTGLLLVALSSQYETPAG